MRAGAKRLGKKPTKKRPLRDEPCMLENGTYSHESVQLERCPGSR